MSTPIPIFDSFTYILDCVPRVWTYRAGLQEFETKHRELEAIGKQLENLKNTVKSKVVRATTQGLECAEDVVGWLDDVESRERGLNEVLDEGSLLLKISWLRACSLCAWWNTEKFLSKVTSEISLVRDLMDRGKFETVSQNPPPPSIQRLPEDPSVGLESVFEDAWSFIQEDTAGIMGLYGIGGVGKTTLLKKMNSEFSKRRCGFDVIIWVVISKKINVGGVRNRIRKRLGLPSFDDEDLSLHPTDIFHNLAGKRFVILLDDIWKELDLESIGIPNPKDPNSANKSKIVFTTRSDEVCGLMAADKKVRVECLNGHQAMELFKNRLGENSRRLRDPEIQKLGESIVKECAGLPLALIVTAGTMASKTTVGEWRYALTTLQKNAAEFSGMEEKVFSVLKFSYDDLASKDIKSCLLFCSLYSEDNVIEVQDLIQQWIGKGYIDGFEEWEQAVDIGYNFIGVLKGTCLLEISEEFGKTTAKMHDIIHDLVHWIARECGVKNDKLLVKTGEQVREAPDAAKWEKAHAVSMMNTRITHLHHIPKCSNLSTFLFIDNKHLQIIPDNFFLYMPTLRFLDLSIHREPDTYIPDFYAYKIIYKSSSNSLGCLPTSIGKLVSLEYLNLTGRNFNEKLPVEMKKLVALKYLFLGETNKVPVGVLKSLLNLCALEVNINGFGNGEDDDMLAGMGELEFLPELKHLRIWISNVNDLPDFLSRARLVSCTWSLDIGKFGIIRSSSSLASFPCLNLGCMEKIRELRIQSSPEIKELAIENKAQFEKLEFLLLRLLPQLIVSWDRKNCVGPFFTNLYSVHIAGCGSMVNLAWLSLAPVLQYLIVSSCARLKGILLEEGAVEEGAVAFDETTFSQLRQLQISKLPSLQSICSNTLPFPFLEVISVRNCPHLKKLPLDSNKSEETLVIEGSSDWWNNLEWESESAKSTFTSAFRANN